MPLFALFSGSSRKTLFHLISTLMILVLPLGAYAESPSSDWGRHAAIFAGGMAAVAGLSQIEESPVLFAALEVSAAFYLLNERSAKPSSERSAMYTHWVTPLALTSLSLVNLTLLREDDTTKGDVFRVNAAGLTAIALWHMWYSHNPKRKSYYFTYFSDSGWSLNRVWYF